MTGEGVKSVVRECYHLSYQIVNGWCALLIDFMSTSNYTESRRTRIVRTNSNRVAESVLDLMLTVRDKEHTSLRSVRHFLNMEEDRDGSISPLEPSTPAMKTPMTKKEYNGQQIPSKLVEKKNPSPQPQKKGVKYILFYPLFLLYPVFVYSLWFMWLVRVMRRFYMRLWSLILPDYAIHQKNAISSISASRLPSDIDVNSEAISGLLEDLQVQLFRMIQRVVQGVRLLWLAAFNPIVYRFIVIGVVTAVSWVATNLYFFVLRIFGKKSSSPSTGHDKNRYEKWKEVETRSKTLINNYFGTLEACRPPTIFDESSVSDSITDETPSVLTKSLLGYPLEEYTVHTTDRYCIVLFRIPRPESKKVVYLQHGVMDTALAWVSDKPSLSLAIQCYLQGYDVFFGSFRGTDGHYESGRRRHEILSVKDKEYWRFDIDDMILDYKAFLQAIYVIKEEERKSGKDMPLAGMREYEVKYKGEIQATNYRLLDEEFLHKTYTLYGISHSMGGAVTLAYIVFCIITHTAHHLSNVVLLSPAGYLNDQSFIVRCIMAVTPLFIKETNSPTAFPTSSSKIHLFVAKLLQDMQNTPATLEFVNQLCSMVIGGAPQEWPFQKVNYTKYPLGVTSLYTMLHFRQWYQKDEFTSYDYGEKGNELRYGQKMPIDFSDYYSRFDVPIHFVAGKFDSIVPSTQVFRHYTKLLPILGKRTSYMEFENAGHLQFTIGLDHDVISYVLDKLAEGNIQGYHGLPTEKKEPLCQFGFSKVDSSFRVYDSCSVSSTDKVCCFNMQDVQFQQTGEGLFQQTRNPITSSPSTYFFFWLIFLW